MIDSTSGARALAESYRRGLLEDVVPFWQRHAIDEDCGGFVFFLDRDGSWLDDDKGVWVHGRFVWLLSTLYADVERRDDWLAHAEHGLAFLREHAFDEKGRMYFVTTREGRPLRQRRYVYTECFGTMALAAYARARGDQRARDEAVALFDLVRRHWANPSLLPAKDTGARPLKALGQPMISIGVSQVLRAMHASPALRDERARAQCSAWIDEAIDEIERDFVHPELGAVLECCGPSGDFVDHIDARTLNPGHAIEAAWFLLDEARMRGGDDRIVRLALEILDLSLERGWDDEYGGLLYFVDLHGKPVQEYWHDMKFWWPHNEAVLATLLAYEASGDPRWAQWHARIHEWTHEHFPDPEYGEWFGYLHRDGRVSQKAKGNLWKGPFHIPRMQLVGWQACERIANAEAI